MGTSTATNGAEDDKSGGDSGGWSMKSVAAMVLVGAVLLYVLYRWWFAAPAPSFAQSGAYMAIPQ